MSEEELRGNLKILENLNKFGHEALIEADKIEYLKEDGTWESLKTLGLSLIPISIYTKRHKNEEKSSLVYELVYKLLILNIEIVPYHFEQIELKKVSHGEKAFSKSYRSIINPDYNEEGITVRYNNANVNTFSKVKNPTTMSSFKKNNKQKLYKSAEIISRSITSNMSRQKIIKK